MSIHYLKAKAACVASLALLTLAAHLDSLYPTPKPEPAGPILQAPLPPLPRVSHTPPLPPLPRRS